jgi:NAD(P)-dependent dehydrogenase (short-subunit alcohol dehydrogenase family)
MVFERFSLDGRVALVTGAGRGLGQAMALTLARAGAAVVAVARTESDIQETVEGVRKLGKVGLAVPLDVTDSNAVDRSVECIAAEFGHIDILVNNAGGEFGLSMPVTSLGDAEWSQILTTNLTGAFYCIRATGRHMLHHHWGRVINVSCVYGARGSINHAAYAAAKGGLMQMSQALALEWAGQGVTVNTLGIGWFERHQQLEVQPEAFESLRRAIPARRFGTPNDIESALIYLASDASRYFTGQSIWLDGGVLCR